MPVGTGGARELAKLFAHTTPEGFAQAPDRERGYKIGKSRERQDEAKGELRQAFPEDEGEDGQADGSHGRASGIDARDFSSPYDAVTWLHAFADLRLLFFLFALGEERGGCGQDRGEGQEEAADAGAVVFCDDSGQGGDDAAKDETDKVFVPVRLSQTGRVDSYLCDDAHSAVPRSAYQRAKAPANHNRSERLVTGRTGHFQRMSMRLTATA